MPGSPATNDRVFRTDLGLEFYWDGTRWVSSTLFTLLFTPTDSFFPITTGGSGRACTWDTVYGLWLVSLYSTTYVGTTNNGSNYWTVSVKGEITSTAYGSFTTAADTAGVYTGHSVALNQLAGSTELAITATYAKTAGSPGGIYGPCVLTYRLIGV